MWRERGRVFHGTTEGGLWDCSLVGILLQRGSNRRELIGKPNTKRPQRHNTQWWERQTSSTGSSAFFFHVVQHYLERLVTSKACPSRFFVDWACAVVSFVHRGLAVVVVMNVVCVCVGECFFLEILCGWLVGWLVRRLLPHTRISFTQLPTHSFRPILLGFSWFPFDRSKEREKRRLCEYVFLAWFEPPTKALKRAPHQ